nr:T9SS type A sorting domain-containing protein [uncultured Flavobacterium sp.]
MKKLIFIALLALPNWGCLAQSPAIEWQRCYGGSGTDYPIEIKNDHNGGYIAVGLTFSANGDIIGFHGGSDIWVLKMDSNGEIIWQKALGGSGDDRGFAIELTLDGGYVVAGNNWSTNGDVIGNHGVWDVWMVKLDAIGNIQWQKSLGGTLTEHARDIKQTFDGGYILTGVTYSNDGDVTINHGAGDVWVVKLDATGNIQWQKTFGGSSWEDGYSIVQTNDNGYILAALTQSTDGDIEGAHGGMDTFIAKLNATGVVEWKKTIGGSGNDRPYNIQIVKDGTDEYIFVGSSSSNDGDVSGNHGGEDYWIVRLDTDGNILWQKSIGDNGTQYARDFYQTSDGGYILNGVTYSVNGMPVDATNNTGSWVVKLDSNGNMQWQKALGGNQGDDGSCVIQTPDGGYLVGSETQSFDIPGTTFHGIQDFLMVKLGSQLSANTFENGIVVIYPNPAKEMLYLSLTNSEVIDKVAITDLAGKLVFEQISHTNPIDVGKLASGMYIVEVSSDVQQWKTKFIKE